MMAPVFLIPFMNILMVILVSAAGRILAALGVTVVSYLGVHYMIDNLLSQLYSMGYSLPYNVSAFVSMFQLRPALNLICSAYIAKYTISGFKKLIWI